MTTPLEGLNEDFREVLSALVREQVDFLVVGAYAVAFHGAPRMTGDLDILVRPNPDNSVRVWHALARFGAPLAAAGVQPADLEKPGMVYQMGLPPRRIDVMTEISGLSFEDAWASRVPSDLEGGTIYFIGKDALLQNKRAAGRPKDLIDIDRFRKR
jgi:hypothetical protein